MKPIAIILCFWALVGCGGKSSPKPPVSALLVFPEKNSECTTGQDINGSSTSLVEFRWQASEHTESYELRATNINTNNTQTIVVSGTSASLPLEKGDAFSWYITSKNDDVSETARSETWLFYNAGSETTYAPFPAEVIAPKTGATVTKDLNNEVVLNWEGADIDNDLAGYEVYFSTENPPTTLIASLTNGTSDVTVSVESGTIYYWSVLTRDLEGNTATNQVSQFRVR